MTVTPHAPAYPQVPIISPNGDVVTAGSYFANVEGMSIRTMLAAMAMQGAMANPAMIGAKSHEIAAMAVDQADTLLAALNKGEPQ